MPDVRGLTLREAVRVLGQVGLQAQLSGTGAVISQTPLPGAPILSGERASLQLQLTRPVAPAPPGGTRR
jgi:cell division protein FtsI (penicillin-binding protein 3)